MQLMKTPLTRFFVCLRPSRELVSFLKGKNFMINGKMIAQRAEKSPNCIDILYKFSTSLHTPPFRFSFTQA